MTDVNRDVLPNLKQLELSCPSTWDMKKILTSCTIWTNRNLDEYKFAGIPLMTFLVCIGSAFESLEKDNDEEAARKSLREAERALEDIRKDSVTADIARAPEHVYQSTAMYIFHKYNKTDELKDMRQKLVTVSELNEKEAAALAGCKSFALGLYHLHFVDEAIDLATKAIAGNKKNALWHFVLGHSLRKKRRNMIDHRSSPSPLELSSFKTAAQLSPHAFYKIYSIQANQEASFTIPARKREAFSKQQLEMYEDVWRTCGDTPVILLKVVLGMIRCHRICNFNTVHLILDKVDQLSKDNTVSFHYRGRAYKFQGNYKKAFEYLKRAGDMSNFAADCDYLYCMLETQKSFEDRIKFLIEMRSKYKDEVAEKQQQLAIYLGILYYTVSDYKSSAKYFLEAIEIQPASDKLKEVHKLGSVIIKNTYEFLSRNILPKCNPRDTVDVGTDREFEDTIQKLQHFISLNNGTKH